MNTVLLQAESQTHVPCHDYAQALLRLLHNFAHDFLNFLRLLHNCVEVRELLELLNLQPKTSVVRISSSYECCIGVSKPIAVIGVNSCMSLSA